MNIIGIQAPVANLGRALYILDKGGHNLEGNAVYQELGYKSRAQAIALFEQCGLLKQFSNPPPSHVLINGGKLAL